MRPAHAAATVAAATVAAAAAVASAAAAARAEAADLVDADRLDLLRGLHHLLDDSGERLDARLVELEIDERGAVRVLRPDEGRGSFRPGEKLVLLRRRPLEGRTSLGLGHRDHRARFAPHPGVVHLRLLGGPDEGERLVTLGGGDVPRGPHPLLGLRLAGPGVVHVDLGRRLLDVLGGELDRVVRPRRLGGQLGFDLLAAELPVAGDLGRPHLALARDARRLPAPLGRRLLLGDIGLARGARGLDLALLDDRRLLLLLGEAQLLPGRVELALAHRDLRVRLDLCALLPVDGDDLGETAHTEGVERVVLVEGVEGGLVEAGERHRFEQEAVLGEVLAEDLAHRRGIPAALVLEALHGVAGRDGEHRVHELALEGLGELGGAEGLAGEGLGGDRDPLLGGPDPHVELRPDVDPEAVRGDHGGRADPLDLELRGPHVDLGHLVEEGQREAAPVEHDLLPAEAGPYQGDLAVGLRIEPVEEPDPDHQDDDENDREDEPEHCALPCPRAGCADAGRAARPSSGPAEG